ncbi:cytosine permease [Vibrio sp.]|nr:cytosine permease [Vibrio sp.]
MSGLGNDNISPTKASERNMGLMGTIFLWVAATMVIPTVMTGQMFIPDLSPKMAFSGVLLASALGCVALALTAVIGTKTGLPTFVIARSTFGIKGAKIFAIINLVILCGWGFIQGYLGALALNKLLIGLFHVDNILLSIFITQGIVLVVTILGHTGIQKIEGLASSAMLIVALVVIYSLLNQYGINELEDLPLSDTPTLTYAIAFDIVLATAFSWMSLPCDYNRYCRSRVVSATGITIGYMLGTIIAMGLGILVGGVSILNNMAPTYDASEILSGQYGLAAALVMFLSIVTTNIMTLYSVVMSAMSVAPKVKFRSFTFILGIVCLAGSYLQERLMASFFDWVLLVGTLVIPVFAIILADFYLVQKGTIDVNSVSSDQAPRYFYTNGYNLSAVVSYVISACFSFYFTYVEPLEIGSTAITFFFAAALYLVIKKCVSMTKSRDLITQI